MLHHFLKLDQSEKKKHHLLKIRNNKFNLTLPLSIHILEQGTIKKIIKAKFTIIHLLIQGMSECRQITRHKCEYQKMN